MVRPHPMLYPLAAGRPIRSVPDEGELTRSAHEHGMSGLLWTRVSAGELSISPKGEAILVQDDLVTRGWTRQIWSVLGGVVRTLAPLGIEVATIKGVTAQARWYDREGERRCTDLDLLLAPDQEDRAPDVVQALQPDHPLTETVGALVATGAAQEITIKVDGVPIDLHVDLLQLGIAQRLRHEVWSRTTPFPLPDGGSVRVLDPESALLNLLVHMNKDRFPFLLGFADVARIIARERIDWSAFERMVAIEGLEEPAWGSLHAVCDTLGLEAPRPPRSGWRAGVWRTLWRPSTRLLGEASMTRHVRRHLLLPFFTGRFAETLRHWARSLFPPRPIAELRFPDVKGSYVRMITWGRVQAARELSREASRLRRRGGPDRDRAAAPRSGDD